MKRRNRLIAMLLALVCIMPCMALPTYAAEPTTEAADVTDTAVYGLLTALDILRDGENFSGVSAITRGRFLSYAVRLYKHETNLGEYENPFSDLSADHTYYNDIVAAYYIGLVSGSGGEIRPDDNITWTEAAKILLGILGYGQLCEANGGYPNGYAAKAGELRLIPNKITSADAITPSELLKVLVNTLETNMCLTTGTKEENGMLTYDFEVNKGKTLLSEIHEVYEGVGTIDANPFTTLWGGDGTSKGLVHIDGIEYRAGNTGAEELLGHSVDYYYREANDERVLVFVTPSRNDEAVTVASDDIVSAKTTARKLVYWDSEAGSEEEVDIAEKAGMILNGVQTALSKTKLCPADGTVTLVDRDGDGDADIALVTSYRTIRVSSTSRFDYTVADSFGGDAIVLDPNDSSYEVSILRNGKEATFADIAKNDIISYAASEGGKVNCKRLVISSETVAGKVTEADDKSVVVDGVSYRVMSRLNPSDLMGRTGTFYLNYLGWIADFDGGQEAVYGFLNAVGYKNGGIEHTRQAQIYTENDRWVDLDFANRVTFNGESMYSKDIVFPEKYRQLITYTVNSEGKIDMMQYAQEVATAEQWTDTELGYIRNGVFRLSRDLSSATYRSVNRSFGGLVALASDAKIFCVPTDGSTDKDEFFMRTVSSLEADKTYSDIKLYDMDEGGVAKVCVMDAAKVKGVVGSGGLRIVAGVGQTTTSEGDSVPSLRVWMDDEKLSLPVASQSVLDSAGGVAAGDLIQYSMDSKGRVVTINKRFDVTKGLEQKLIINSIYTSETFAAGYIEYYSDNSVRFDAGTQFLFTTKSLGSVYIYDTADKSLTIGTKDDLREGIYGFVRLNYLQAKDFIIFR